MAKKETKDRGKSLLSEVKQAGGSYNYEIKAAEASLADEDGLFACLSL